MVTVNVTTTTKQIAVQMKSQGPRGLQGPAGPSGAGLPDGGEAGQTLEKQSNTDLDVVWTDMSKRARKIARKYALIF